MEIDGTLKLLYPIDGVYMDEDDKAWLEALPERQREEELTARHEDVVRLMQRRNGAKTRRLDAAATSNAGPVLETAEAPPWVGEPTLSPAELKDLAEKAKGIAKQAEELLRSWSSQRPRRSRGGQHTTQLELVSVVKNFTVFMRGIQEEVSKMGARISGPSSANQAQSDLEHSLAAESPEGSNQSLIETGATVDRDGSQNAESIQADDGRPHSAPGYGSPARLVERAPISGEPQPPAEDCTSGRDGQSGDSNVGASSEDSPPASPLTDLSDFELSDNDTSPISGSATVAIFPCSYEDLRFPTKDRFNEISRDSNALKCGFAKLQFRNLPPVDAGSIRQPDETHCVSFSYKREKDFTRVTERAARNTLVVPGLPCSENQKTDWTPKELRDKVESILEHPREATVSYIVGPPLFDDIEMHPGDKLMRRGTGDMLGVQTAYMYWNTSGGSTITVMHKEDGNVGSVNVVRSGDLKVLVTIEPSFNERFEQHMRQEFPGVRDCSQFVRHLSRGPLLKKLDEWGIAHHLTPIGPNEGFLTMSGTYHMAINLGDNLAMAINFEDAESPYMPKDYKFCTARCPGKGHITEAHWQPRPDFSERRKSTGSRQKSSLVEVAAVELTLQQKRPKTRQTTDMTSDLEKIKAQIQAVDPRCSIPLSTGYLLSPAALKLAAVVRSRPMIDQFCSLIRTRRSPGTHRLPVSRSADRVGLVARLKSIRDSENGKCFLRFNQVFLADEVDNSKNGRLRANPTVAKHILDEVGFNLSQYKHHLKVGRQWKKICGVYKGLLCFIPQTGGNPFAVSPKAYRDMEDETIQAFHRHLDDDFTRSLCKAGKAFEDSINGSTDVEFQWERVCIPSKLRDEEMLSSLQVFPAVQENVYSPDDFPDWPRPEGWPEGWPWPADPTSMPVTGVQCSLCQNQACDCLQNNFSSLTPRIREYPGKGRGLEAVANNPGQIAYEKNTLIGRLTGKIAPTSTYSDDWTLDFVLPIGEEPTVCQIHCGDMGNCFRLLNHSCRPTARFEQMIVSGRCVTAVRAIVDIYDGTEITVSYSTNWAESRDCRCEVCVMAHGPQG